MLLSHSKCLTENYTVYVVRYEPIDFYNMIHTRFCIFRYRASYKSLSSYFSDRLYSERHRTSHKVNFSL